MEREVLSTRHLADLPQLFAQSVQLLHWQRPLPVGAQAYLAGLAQAGALGLGRRETWQPGSKLSLAPWPASPARQALEEDLAFLIDVYATLLDCQTVGWRIEVLHHSMCPRFHVDRTGIRLVCTWRGPGTEWLASTGLGLDRRLLGAGSGGRPDEASGLMHGQQLGRSQAGDVLWLKGSLWQGNAAAGAVHRSPALGPEDAVPRVMLVLDAMD